MTRVIFFFPREKQKCCFFDGLHAEYTLGSFCRNLFYLALLRFIFLSRKQMIDIIYDNPE